jgi:hypothetical protein
MAENLAADDLETEEGPLVGAWSIWRDLIQRRPD